MDDYIVEVGERQIALRAYVRSWETIRQPTTSTPAGLKFLEGMVQSDVLDYAKNMATFGVFAKWG